MEEGNFSFCSWNKFRASRCFIFSLWPRRDLLAGKSLVFPPAPKWWPLDDTYIVWLLRWLMSHRPASGGRPEGDQMPVSQGRLTQALHLYPSISTAEGKGQEEAWSLPFLSDGFRSGLEVMRFQWDMNSLVALLCTSVIRMIFDSSFPKFLKTSKIQRYRPLNFLKT